MLIRNVSIGGHDGLDVKLEGDRIVAIGKRLAPERLQFDGAGGVLMMGLVDHHCHLLASAAQSSSVDLHDVQSLEELAARLRQAAGLGWIRAIGCPPVLAEALTTYMLDSWQLDRPARIQDQTGALWVLNSAALARIDEDLPPCVERGGDGRITGRVWRGDAWLGQAIGRTFPDLARVGTRLARLGITAITDASATTDAHRAGDLPQRLTLMSAGRLSRPQDGAFEIGPVKMLLDERELPLLDDLVKRMRLAREQSRAVAVHCVTATELALTLAAFQAGGARPGDRIEHGNVIPADAIPVIHRLGLAVVIQPGWTATRGDRYLADVEPIDRPDLMRCATLLNAGIRLAAGSDSPYGQWDCWAAMCAAVSRTTLGGQSLNPEEAITARAALDLYRAAPDNAGGAPRQVRQGALADLCLLAGPLPNYAEDFAAERVSATWINGKLVHHAAICEEDSSSAI
jgi:predicted amidohydrolase YtcJ